MKTTLLIVSLVSAAAVPSALAIELAGVALPSALHAPAAFGLFVVASIALTLASDYDRQPRALTVRPSVRHSDKAAHPLAA